MGNGDDRYGGGGEAVTGAAGRPGRGGVPAPGAPPDLGGVLGVPPTPDR